jgi:hypothetical protein
MQLDIWYNGPIPWLPAGVESFVRLRPTWQPSRQRQSSHPGELVDLESVPLQSINPFEFRNTSNPVYVPPLIALNSAQMRVVASVFDHLFLCINGLSLRNIELIQEQMRGKTIVFTYRLAGRHTLENLEILSWLQTHADAFAFKGDHEEALATAVAFGAQNLLIESNRTIDLSWPLRLFQVRSGENRQPPLRPSEMDLLEEGTTSLVANCFCQAGSTLDLDMMAEQIAETRGISPILLEKVVGKKLRYDLAPGEPITFGHLDGEKTECCIRKCL